MQNNRTKVLIVDDDPETYDLIANVVLAEGEYDCIHAADGAEGIQMTGQHTPNLIIVNLAMPGLTGQDMLVGIQQKHYTGPIIVMTERGNEKKAIDAFRLGATDLVTKPIRPPEALSVIERAMKDIQLQREKANLVERIQTTNDNLQEKVKELTLLGNVGRLLTGMRGLDELYELVLTSMIDLTNADHATILLQEVDGNGLRLVAGKNLSLVMQDNLGEIIKDEVAGLVLTSQEPLVIAGDGLKRFKAAAELKAAIYVPMIAHKKPIGVLTVGNHIKKNEFTDDQGHLIKAMGDYVAVGITNARLFSALDMRARNSEDQMAQRQKAMIDFLQQRFQKPLVNMEQTLSNLTTSDVPDTIKPQLMQLHSQTQTLLGELQRVSPKKTGQNSRPSGIHRISPKT